MVSPYGHFSNEGREFIITTPNTPRHWYNYLWNDNYITFTSQVGFGEGFAQDETGRRITLISNRNVFIIDADQKEYWTANALPVKKEYNNYQCIHGLGYSKIELEYKSISSSLRLFVPRTETCEIWTVQIKNHREKSCRLKIIPYFRTELDGGYKPQGYNSGTGFFDTESQAVIGRTVTNFLTSDNIPVYGYLTGSGPINGFDSRKNAFIGTYGEELTPLALESGGCTNSDCLAEKLCFALETVVELQSGEECELHFVAGITLDKNEIKNIREKFFTANETNKEYELVKSQFGNQIDDVNIDTPDANLNCLFNSWLKHQTNMGSRWARVRHNGFRDLTSDIECLSAINPKLAWSRLKRILTIQYSNGYAPRTWLDGSIKDNNFSDNTVWLTFAVYSLVKEIGDLDILDEEVAFNDGSKATVYEHIKRSVDFLWNFKGLHGLTRIWGGDWNDCMNRAGLQGKGVSIWLSIAWYRANKQFAEIARLKGFKADADLADIRGEEMQKLVDQYGWDGEYYIAVYTDEGIKLGSSENREGKIFIIPQLWAFLSGISKDGKDIKAMEAVDKYLETDLGTLVSWPAYTENAPYLGAMTRKPAGVHENGGVYLHTSVWKLATDSILKRNHKVQEGLEKILPFNHKWVQKKCEPYIMCNSYFTEETGYRYATAGQSWRTATGAWLAKALVIFVFGLQPELEGIRLNPCLPPDWRVCTIRKSFRNAQYHIEYQQAEDGACNSISEIIVNDLPHHSPILPYTEGMVFNVKVKLIR